MKLEASNKTSSEARILAPWQICRRTAKAKIQWETLGHVTEIRTGSSVPGFTMYLSSFAMIFVKLLLVRPFLGRTIDSSNRTGGTGGLVFLATTLGT